MDLNDVLATIPFNSAGLSLRARLEADIRDVLGTSETVDESTTRGLDEDLLGETAGAEMAMAEPGDDERGAGPPVTAADAESDAESDAGGPVIAVGATRQRYRAYGLLACDETVLVERPFRSSSA